jgi:hypothetical protein
MEAKLKISLQKVRKIVDFVNRPKPRLSREKKKFFDCFCFCKHFVSNLLAATTIQQTGSSEVSLRAAWVKQTNIHKKCFC